MKLASIINPAMIVCKLPGSTREEQYGALLDRVLPVIGSDVDQAKLLDTLKEREDSIQMPYDRIALPHHRSSEFHDLFLAVGLPEKPVKLKDYDSSPSQFILLSLISPSTSGVYLKSLAAFSRYLLKPGNLEKLCGATSPEEFIAILDADKVELKGEITAEDVMLTVYPSVTVDTPLSHALDLLTRENIDQVPVVDAAGRLCGVLDATEMLRNNIPSYMMMMNNLKFLTSFEPFEKIFKEEEQNVTVDKVMRQPLAEASPDTPLIQLTITLAKKEAPNIYVIDKDRRLLGLVSVRQLIHKVLRG